jgi:hypothetical protein
MCYGPSRRSRRSTRFGSSHMIPFAARCTKFRSLSRGNRHCFPKCQRSAGITRASRLGLPHATGKHWTSPQVSKRTYGLPRAAAGGPAGNPSAGPRSPVCLLTRDLRLDPLARMGGADEPLPSTARFHRWARRRGGRGRSRRARSRESACGGSACSCRTTKTVPRRRLTPLLSRKRLRTWVGPLAATCGRTFGGVALTPIGFERSRRSWSGCSPTSF